MVLGGGTTYEFEVRQGMPVDSDLWHQSQQP